jgi:uncharacterized protein HemX
MRIPVVRKNIQFLPDSSRVVARYFMSGDERTQALVLRVMGLSESQISRALEQTLREFANRHRNISRIFYRHFANIQGLLEHMQIDTSTISENCKMLIGY